MSKKEKELSVEEVFELLLNARDGKFDANIPCRPTASPINPAVSMFYVVPTASRVNGAAAGSRNNVSSTAGDELRVKYSNVVRSKVWWSPKHDHRLGIVFRSMSMRTRSEAHQPQRSFSHGHQGSWMSLLERPESGQITDKAVLRTYVLDSAPGLVRFTKVIGNRQQRGGGLPKIPRNVPSTANATPKKAEERKKQQNELVNQPLIQPLIPPIPGGGLLSGGDQIYHQHSHGSATSDESPDQEGIYLGGAVLTSPPYGSSPGSVGSAPAVLQKQWSMTDDDDLSSQDMMMLPPSVVGSANDDMIIPNFLDERSVSSGSRKLKREYFDHEIDNMTHGFASMSAQCDVPAGSTAIGSPGGVGSTSPLTQPPTSSSVTMSPVPVNLNEQIVISTSTSPNGSPNGSPLMNNNGDIPNNLKNPRTPRKSPRVTNSDLDLVLNCILSVDEEEDDDDDQTTSKLGGGRKAGDETKMDTEGSNASVVAFELFKNACDVMSADEFSTWYERHVSKLFEPSMSKKIKKALDKSDPRLAPDFLFPPFHEQNHIPNRLVATAVFKGSYARGFELVRGSPELTELVGMDTIESVQTNENQVKLYEYLMESKMLDLFSHLVYKMKVDAHQLNPDDYYYQTIVKLVSGQRMIVRLRCIYQEPETKPIDPRDEIFNVQMQDVSDLFPEILKLPPLPY